MSDSREHILDTALVLFMQKSFKEVTMREIVEQTGLSKGAFYHYFSSKEQVFEEVIRFFFSELMVGDYGKFSHDSLYAFYNDILAEIDNKIKRSKIKDKDGEKLFNANHYFLIFDAMKMLPGFKKELEEQQRIEMEAWVNIMGIARDKGEINSTMTNEQLAKMFVYLNDGVGINLIMKDGLLTVGKELKPLMDGLYNLIKA